MQAVPSKRCRTKAQTERLYFRSGALAYLIFLLRGVDFHAANLVVNGENPVFVDVETLLHPVTATPPEFQEQEASILRTGLLPAIGCRDSHSGFTQLARHWHNARSGGVTSVPEPLVIGLLDGFNAMHAFLTAKRHRLRHLERLVAELARSEGRIVYRPSEHYARALFQSFAPELMRTARDRRSFLLHFCERNSSSKRRVLQECAALENGDIPVFRSSLRRIRLDLRPKIASEARMLIKRHLGFAESFCSPPGA
jgi:lantibiotic modifying enzyme